MIAKHDFNSEWWGEPCGIVTDPGFFALPAPEQSRLLGEFAWVEFRAPLHEAPPAGALGAAGFQWVDAQVGFRIDLRAVAPPRSAPEVLPATEIPAAAMRAFHHERFSELPGLTTERLARRYADWAAGLVAANPEWCIEVRHDGAPQGWFCSRPERGLNLALAMQHRDATISGLDLYAAAFVAYAQRGARVGWASFSIRNGGVHNVYADLGARFTPPVGCWLWWR